MNNFNIIFIGLDTHKTFTQLAVLKDERCAKPESLGKINTNKAAFIKLARQLQSKYSKATLHFIYEEILDTPLTLESPFNRINAQHKLLFFLPPLNKKRAIFIARFLFWLSL